jgi:hypothetical protein
MVQRLANMCGRESVPYDVCKKAGDMDECADRKTIVVSHRQKPDARSDTCPQNADAFVSSGNQPIGSPARIVYGLANRGRRAADVGRNQVFRTFEVERLSIVVIRQAQSHGRDTHTLKHATQTDLPVPLAIPLRQDNDSEILVRRKEPAVDRIVFGIACLHSARKFQNLAVEFVLRREFVGKKCRAIAERVRDVIMQRRLRVAVRMNPDVFRTIRTAVFCDCCPARTGLCAPALTSPVRARFM